MSRTVRALLAIGLIAGAGLALALRSENFQDRLLDAAVARRVKPDHTELFDAESLNVAFCGTGSPIPDPDRGAACIAVFAGDRAFLVDVGPGSWTRFAELRIPAGKLEGVLLTHFHSDHIGGLGELTLNSWAQGRTEGLRIYGGPGVENVAHGFEIAYSADSHYRHEHHGKLMPESGAKLVPIRIDSTDPDAVMPVLDDGDLKIVAFRVKHPPVDPAYGYRIDYKGRSLIFSGDTMATPAMSRVGRDVDVMVHEALSPPMMEKVAVQLEKIGDPQRGQILREAITYHTPPVEAAEIANAANARLLVFSHVIPPLPNKVAEKIFLRGVADVRPKGTLIGRDGMTLRLPAGSSEIITGKLE